MSMIDVTSYGAKGDGVTDDSQAFQDVLAAAKAQNRSVYIPASPNEYLLDDFLTIECSLIGDSHHGSRLRFKNNGNEHRADLHDAARSHEVAEGLARVLRTQKA